MKQRLNYLLVVRGSVLAGLEYSPILELVILLSQNCLNKITYFSNFENILSEVSHPWNLYFCHSWVIYIIVERY